MVVTLRSGISVRTQRITVPVYNLEYERGGALAIEQALAKLPGVSQCYANSAAATVYVDYDPIQVCPNEIIAAIKTQGFTTGQPEIL